MKIKIDYHETTLDHLMRFYAADLKHKDGEIRDMPEYFVDPVKNKVIFKLMVDVKEK